ncbi:hypothetical protein L873DRAFT_271672 [Choiromyces venosus 120613-1]|uniref:Uncharacterized protein n=1 Tax=Choiromyces venosus 120613-1 TaxID=1336337 RepID=A0A3N4J3Q8_9PEZI|nr:hypothetical protein L873DRAFT_271672 [Choiromyces venosus 120613-1]
MMLTLYLFISTVKAFSFLFCSSQKGTIQKVSTGFPCGLGFLLRPTLRVLGPFHPGLRSWLTKMLECAEPSVFP